MRVESENGSDENGNIEKKKTVLDMLKRLSNEFNCKHQADLADDISAH